MILQRKKVVIFSYLVILSILGILILVNKRGETINVNKVEATGGVDQESEQKLIDSFFHEYPIEGGKAILEKGEVMVPLLMKLKGHQDFFFPIGLGSSNAAHAWRFPIEQKPIENKSVYDNEGDIVTQEVAAIYLICAIYNKRLDFAQTPLLTDLTLPAEKRRARNTQELVSRAWMALETWSEALKKDGLASLQERNYTPLRDANVAFW